MEDQTSEDQISEERTSKKFWLTIITLLAAACILSNLVLIVSTGYLLMK